MNVNLDSLLISLGYMALPVLIVWLIGRVRQNETNRRAEIILKALEKGAAFDPSCVKFTGNDKTIKGRLFGTLTACCISSLLGVAFVVLTIVFTDVASIGFDVGPQPLLLILGATLLAVGIALFIVYLSLRKYLKKDNKE